MYYLRTKAASDAVKFTVEKQAEAVLQPVTEEMKEKEMDYVKYAEQQSQAKASAQGFADDPTINYDAIQCSLDDPEGCEMCGS